MTDTTVPETVPAKPAQRPDFEFRNPARLTSVVSVLLILGAAVSVIEALSDGAQYAILASHQLYDQQMWIGVQELFNAVQLLLLIVTAIPFLMWVYRANWNAHALGAADMRYRPGWAVGWYFVPIASLWMPYRVMREIWRVSVNPGDWQNAPGSSLLGWWWALYLFKSGLSGAAYGDKTEASVVDLMNDAAFGILACLVSAAASLLAWRLLRKIAANQLFQANIAQVF